MVPVRRSKRVHIPVVDKKFEMLSNFLAMHEEKAKALKERRSQQTSTASTISKIGSKNSTIKSIPYSLLGDTNAANSTTCTGVSISHAVQRTARGARALSPIAEPPAQNAETRAALQTKSNNQRKKKQNNKGKEEVLPIESSTPLQMPLNGSCVEHSRLNFSCTPVENLNALFDQLKHNDNSVAAVNEVPPMVSMPPVEKYNEMCRPLRVRVKRTNENNISPLRKKREKIQKSDENTTKNKSTKSSQNTALKRQEDVVEADAISSSKNLAENKKSFQDYNEQLLGWLKGVCVPELTTVNPTLFNDMRCSAPSNLLFANLDGIDYAFYDTEDKYSLGYLRFKPRQVKSSKRAKRYHLHFIVLSGRFKISTDNDNAVFETGYMVAINIGARYKIENLTDDIGLMMVMKLK